MQYKKNEVAIRSQDLAETLPLRQLKYLTAIEIIYEDLSVSLRISVPV